MVDRTVGQKSFRFLDKRMRLCGSLSDRWDYSGEGWDIVLRKFGGDAGFKVCYWCDLSPDPRGPRGPHIAVQCRDDYPTAEEAIAECEKQTLMMFKKLGTLCGYVVAG